MVHKSRRASVAMDHTNLSEALHHSKGKSYTYGHIHLALHRGFLRTQSCLPHLCIAHALRAMQNFLNVVPEQVLLYCGGGGGGGT
jgi:hypothetical protein